ncbi:MAG: hypothetical protein ACLFUS_11470, partial [Candidatus Sumerlaeia bacterium]
DAGGTFFDHEIHEKPETAELFVVQPLFLTGKKVVASRRTPDFVPDRISGWNMPYAKAKTGISMKDQGKLYPGNAGMKKRREGRP